MPANMHMKYFWCVLNFTLLGLGLLGGYNSMNQEKLRHINPDPILCLVVLLIMPLFALGSVTYAIRRWKRDVLDRPSWTRNPFNWWGDPLAVALCSYELYGCDGHWECCPASRLRISWFLGLRSVRLLCDWTISGTDSGISDLSTTHRLRWLVEVECDLRI